jgi:hypothetical protein
MNQSIKDMFYLFLDGFQLIPVLLSCYVDDCYSDFWEVINTGYYDQYIYPYDEWYNPTISEERKLRIGK